MSQKIVFMGTPEFSIPTLESLINSNHKILAVYSQPASKANRGQKTIPSEVEVLAKEHSLNLRTPNSLDNHEEYNYLKKLEPDIVVVIAYGKIIPKKFLDLSKYGFINVHASLLPKWRGAAPIQRSIMNLDNQTGISIMKIVEELDAGPVMHQDKIQINENVDALTLSKVLSKLGAKSIINAIDKIEKGEATFIEQDHGKATYAKKILKTEGRINWNENAKKVLAKINGLNPNPGAWFEYKNERLKVWKAEIVNQNSNAGKITDDRLTIACKEQSIKILEIQKEGKSRQLTDHFLLGNEIKSGDIIT
ncbi:methionyl-tRNA formyltransferase [Pelagibacterales bacterium SAG-MED05]|nr:methionyl-tRNA formyltransferase [Pelagibacterales bacterium SAG-MED05]